MRQQTSQRVDKKYFWESKVCVWIISKCITKSKPESMNNFMFCRQRRRSGSSIVVLDGDTALKKPTGFEYLDMLPSDQDTGKFFSS